MSTTTRPPGRGDRRAPGRQSARHRVASTRYVPATRSGPPNRAGSARAATMTVPKAPPAASPEPPATAGLASGRFIGVVIGILVAGLLLLLAVNTSLASGAFTMSRLEYDLIRLTEQREATAGQVNVLSSADRLHERALRLGLVAVPAPAFIDLDTGRLDGRLIPAQPGPSSQPDMVAPKPTPQAEPDAVEPSPEPSELAPPPAPAPTDPSAGPVPVPGDDGAVVIGPGGSDDAGAPVPGTETDATVLDSTP